MKHKIDLYASYKKNTQRSSKIGFGSGFTLYILVLLLIVGGYYTFENLHISKLEEKKSLHQSYVNDATNQKNFKEVSVMNDQIREREAYQEKVISVSDVLGDKRKIYSYVINAIEAAKPSTVEVNNISINRSQVTIDFVSTSPNGPSVLAANLRRNGSFADVVYTGYSRNEGGSDETPGEDGESSIVTIIPDTFTGSINIVLEGGF